MTNPDLYEQITDAIVDGMEDEALALTQMALAQGHDPLEIIDLAFMPGMAIVGDDFEAGVCFVPELVMAGKIMRSVMDLMEDELRRRAESVESAGKIVLGTVAGDIHTIGKDMVSTLLSLNGFEVVDLGANVPIRHFVDAVRREQPQILGLSALITTTMPKQEEVIQALEVRGLRAEVKVIVGGASTSQEWADQIGADGYAENANRAVALCTELLAA